MLNKILSANIVIFVLLLSACSGGSKTSVYIDEKADTLLFKYATNIKILKYKDFTKVELRNPWDTLKPLHTYILTDKSSQTTDNIPKGTIVRTPLKKSLIYSSVHCSVFDDLGASQSVAGVCDFNYINLPFIKERKEKNLLTDCGSSLNPDIEKIIDLSPDAILLSPFENNGGYGRIEKLNIPIIECADYVETTPLGRAEWIKFFGLLTGREDEANKLFSEIENKYNSLKAKTQMAENRPTVITEMKYNSAWYVPGGQSTIARLLSDAGADYIFKYTEGSGSVPLSFETVLDKGHNADFWLIKYNQKTYKTYSEIASDYAPYCNFAAWKNRKIYACNTAYTNYYEESPFHPERLLENLISIFHPEITESNSSSYYTPLKQ